MEQNGNGRSERLAQLDEFDRLLAEYEGLPQALKTQPAIVRVTPFMPVDPVATWTVQTIKHSELGEFVFIERTRGGATDDKDRYVRIVIPPKVVALITRQRDALITKARSHAARERFANVPRDYSHLSDPKVRARALAARKAKAAKRRARKAAK